MDGAGEERPMTKKKARRGVNGATDAIDAD